MFFATVEPLMPAWALMWGLGVVVFFAVKLATMMTVGGWSGTAALNYVFLTPTLNPAPFVTKRDATCVDDRSWTAAVAIAAALLLWIVVVPALRPISEWLAGLAAMSGAICFLHYGVFRLLTAAMQWRGRRVDVLMNDPWRAGSLAEFWGRRWNTAFRDASQRLIVRPLRASLSPRLLMWVVFLFSGLVHDLVISVPSGGYGLPTLYFLIQALGITAERRAPVRGLLAGDPRIGTLWTAVWLLLPVPLLFHRPFCVDVILPCYDAAVAGLGADALSQLDAAAVTQVGGCLQLTILLASFATPFLLDWRTMLAPLPKLLQQMFWVYGAYIVMTIVALGSASLVLSDQLANGSTLAAAIISFTAVFWGLRLVIGVVGFDSEPFLTTSWHRFGYAMLHLAFVMLTILYSSLAARAWSLL